MTSKILQANTMAPDFSLPVTSEKKLSLSEFKGKPVILTFYPADFSPVCSGQMAIYNELLPEFRKYNAEVLGVSVDGPWCHAAFTKQSNLHFPLLSDFEPKGAVAKKYGVYREHDGLCERAIFVINKERKITWSYLSPFGEDPGADGILKALENL